MIKSDSENNHVVITAWTVKSNQLVEMSRELGYSPSSNSIDEGSFFYEIILALIKKVCDGMRLKIVQSEFYQESGYLAVLVKADISGTIENIQKLREILNTLGNRLKMVIKVQKDDLFQYMHRI